MLREMKIQIVISTILVVLMLISPFNVLKADKHATHHSDSTGKVFFNKLKLTSLAYGGTGVLFTRVNDQFGVMTGGRGSATFNNRYTFGGAGWGMPKGIEMKSHENGSLEFFKFGYGGLEFGYLFFEGEKVRLGSNLLLACGVGFQETIPKSKGEVNMFPVFEPSLYSQITLGKLLRLDLGVTYRFITGSKFSFIDNRQLSGPSVYIAFLVGTCKCD
jgi:hypothetical protein